MKLIFLALLLGLSLVGLGSCLPSSTPLPLLPTEIPTLARSATPTTVWFPATATYTPLPTRSLPLTPTLETRPQYGSLILNDDFSDPGSWSLGRSPTGSMALGKNELTLVVTQPQGYLTSFRQNDIFGDFYLEITASPSICRGGDEYGLLLRVSPSRDYYRFTLNCAGQARLDRLVDGQASSPQPPVMNWAIPPGAPSSSRLGVWAWGKELRFYVNGEYLFTVRDPTLPKGGLGVFARASGADSITVNFSDLQVYEVTN